MINLNIILIKSQFLILFNQFIIWQSSSKNKYDFCGNKLFKSAYSVNGLINAAHFVHIWMFPPSVCGSVVLLLSGPAMKLQRVRK